MTAPSPNNVAMVMVTVKKPDSRCKSGFRTIRWPWKAVIENADLKLSLKNESIETAGSLVFPVKRGPTSASWSKIDLTSARWMLLSGKSRAEVASYFGVTHQSLSSFLRNWSPDLVGKRRGPKAKIDYADAAIRHASGQSIEAIAEHYGVHVSGACRAINFGRLGINS